ncbi:hypothetical protein ACEO96_14930 [Vibrio anguillarum]|uniref:hypothetical protein n=1 Tax=Vibrio anguillarum TaxID=55601 RepID=UPI003593C421
MSSKYIEKAWSHQCVTMDEKLVLVALAELADRNGAVITKMSELISMTSGSESALVNVIGKLAINQDIIGLNRRAARDEGHLQCRLNIGVSYDVPQVSEATTPPGSRGSKLPPYHNSQVKPLNSHNSSGKTINVSELSHSVIEEWAEIVMFRTGFAGQTSAWAGFVDKLKTSSQQLLDLNEVTTRLHSHLVNEKNYRQKSSFSGKSNAKKVRLSPHQEFKKKMSNFNFDD